MEDQIFNVVPYLRFVGGLFTMVFVVVILAMFKSYVTEGISIAVTEFLIQAKNPEERAKLLARFGSAFKIIEHLKRVEKRMDDEKKQAAEADRR